MGKTSIEWVAGPDGSPGHSINPIRADRVHDNLPAPIAVGHYCEKISSGCANCYASTLQKRFKMPAFPGPTRDSDRVPLDGVTKTGVRAWLDESKLAEIRKRRKPTRYFVCDMTDPFGWWVRDEWLDAMFATFDACQQHTFLLLTKRPRRMRDYLAEVSYPQPNVWLGVSAENQKTWDDRVSFLAATPAAVRFVSVEPMLEAIDMSYPKSFYPNGPEYCCSGHECGCHGLPCDPPMLYDAGVGWVIFGGESGQGARPCNVEWIRDGLTQCKAAGVAAFVKQLGARSVEPNPDAVFGWQPAGTIHPKGGEPAEWPDDLRIRQIPRVK